MGVGGGPVAPGLPLLPDGIVVTVRVEACRCGHNVKQERRGGTGGQLWVRVYHDKHGAEPDGCGLAGLCPGSGTIAGEVKLHEEGWRVWPATAGPCGWCGESHVDPSDKAELRRGAHTACGDDCAWELTRG